jgi:type IV secretory pathway TraG/TraD family ATPase VirD4
MNRKSQFMKSVSWPNPCYASITCSTISNIPYNLNFTTKLMIPSCALNLIYTFLFTVLQDLTNYYRISVLQMTTYMFRLSLSQSCPTFFICTHIIIYQFNMFAEKHYVAFSACSVADTIQHICIVLYLSQGRSRVSMERSSPKLKGYATERVTFLII